MITQMFEPYCAQTLRFLKKDCTAIVPQMETSCVNSLLRLLDEAHDCGHEANGP